MSQPSEVAGRLRRPTRHRISATAACLVAAAYVVSTDFAVQAAEPASRPNVMVIVADDLGYADLGVQGCKDVPTPNIDSLAKAGVRFTNGYVSCPVCSPTRAGLMTGRYQQRFGHEHNPGPAESAPQDFGLPLTETTFADRMKALGYATGAVGKWHLGYTAPFHPLKRGFDEFFGFLGGAHSYVNNRDQANPVQRRTTPVEVSYTTDQFGAEAVSFIGRHKNRPWFLYLTFNAVHAPMDTTDAYLVRFAAIEDPKRRKFAAMLAAMDENVGHVLGTIRRAGQEENTLIFFVSDNGGPTPVTTSRNDPLSGFKGQTYEGGIRVPMIIQWKGRLPAGKVFEQPVIALDFLPTAVAASGGTISSDTRLDGVNLLPYLKGENANPPHDRLFWRMGDDKWAVRMGDWKLRHDPSDDGIKLFHLKADIREANDLAAKEPEKFNQLKTAFDEWNAQLEQPRWGQKANAKKNAKKKKAA